MRRSRSPESGDGVPCLTLTRAAQRPACSNETSKAAGQLYTRPGSLPFLREVRLGTAGIMG